ncbi:MAG: histidine phosphatase family protein [Eubacteriales bacterium]
MNLYLIRHGNTQWNTLNKIQGSQDIPLNQKGIDEAKGLKVKIENLPIEIVFSSPLQRAVQTGKIINSARLPFYIVEDLKELDFGEWEGLSWQEVMNQYPLYLNQHTIKGYANPPGGETYNQASVRIMNMTHFILRQPYYHIALITHRAVIRFMLSYLFKESLERISTFELPNTAIIKVTLEKGHAMNWKYL